MTDGQESTVRPVAKRARPGRAREKAPADRAVPQGYVAMHEVNAAMCLAGGILAPRFEESAARDHHVVAGAIQVEPKAPSAQSLAAAQGDLSYGNVVVLEVPLPAVGTAPPPSLPLWRATRLVFESREARDLFRARMSGYGDVPDDVLPMEVDAMPFSARGAAVQTTLLAPADATEGDTDGSAASNSRDASVAKAFRAIDRCAGSLLAAASTLQGSPGATRLVEAVGGLAPSKPGESPVEQFASVLASVADPSPDAETFAPVLAAVASVLSSGAMDDGFSAKALVRKAEPASGKGLPAGSPKQHAIQKFWAFTKDVLEFRREVPEGAWSDEGGSAIARGTLLFMLNPEPEQLQAVRHRVPNVGTAVHFVAGLLVGIRSGLTRMGREVKAARDPFLAGAAFAHDWLRGKDASLALQRKWDPVDGTYACSLAYEGTAIAEATGSADPLLATLAAALRDLGVQVRFSPDAGVLTGKLAIAGPETVFGAVEVTQPTFPRQSVLEAWALVSAKLARRVAGGLAAEVNGGTHEHCVSAQLVEVQAGRVALRLSVLVLKSSACEPLNEALAALVSKARGLALPLPAKVGRRTTPDKGASSGKAKVEGEPAN